MAQKTVLLIEDHLEDRNMYGNILWYNGYNVIEAEDGEAGLRLATDRRPDVIILDLNLPLLHGQELNSRLQQDDRTKDIPVIALTGRRLSELGGNASILGYARFLEKPISPLQVLRVVEDLVGAARVDQAERAQRPQVVRTEAPQPSRETRDIAARVLVDVEKVVDIWLGLVKEEPWFSLPREHRLSNIPQLIEALMACALLSPVSVQANRACVEAGTAHGYTRRKQKIPESIIPIEFHLLRSALWRYLNETFAPSEGTYSTILRIDRSISTALNAAMWGYYREEIEAHETWESAIERLVADATEGAAIL